jgi:enoyl-CoA hydratase
LPADILIRREGAIGRFTLNRPQALNALTHEMCAEMYQCLHEWAQDEAVHAVLIDAAPGRAFCAGGDIRSIYQMGRENMAAAEAFFATEYRLNAAIRRFPKTYVALINGITMGGGAGVSVHGTYPVVGESASFAMPETAIGLYPDVGGTYFLSRLTAEAGTYLGLTGVRIGFADMLWLGLATHYVPAARFGAVVAALAQGDPADALLVRLAEPPPESPLAERAAEINQAFAASSVEEILANLQRGSEWARNVAQELASKSPTSLKLTLKALREARKLNFNDCMRMEYRLTLRVLRGHDLYEGVRAALIDRDQQPRWDPPTLAEVSDAAIESYFSPLGIKELAI